MPAYNFQYQFAAAVKHQLKRSTIRAKRKNRPRVGQTAYCYTGMRTKSCYLLGRWIIREVRDINILSEGVLLDGGALSNRDLDKLARLDGFLNWPDMAMWFDKTHGLPFHGDLIIW